MSIDNIITIKTITQLNTGIKINGKVLLVEEEIQINKFTETQTIKHNSRDTRGGC